MPPFRLSALGAAVLAVLACGGGADGVTGPRVPAAIVLIPNHPEVPQGLTLQLTATVVDANGREIRNQAVAFSSSDNQVLTVNGHGLVTSVGPVAVARITADLNGLTDFVEVVVTQRAAALEVTPNPLILNRDQSRQLGVVLRDFIGDPVFTASVPQFVPGNTLITVDPNGLVQAGAATGTTTLTVTLGSFTVQVPVTVAIIPTTIEVVPTDLILSPGASSVPLAVTVRDAVGVPIVGAPVTFTSNAPAVFSVSPGGVVTSLGPNGSGTVTVASGSLSTPVGVFVGAGPAGNIVQTTMVPGAAYGAAITDAGAMVVSLASGPSVVRGDLPAFTFPTTVTVPFQPLGVAVNHAGTRAYAGTSAGVAVIDLVTNTLLTSFAFGGPGNNVIAVAVSDDDQTLYVGANGWVWKVDAATGQAVDSVSVNTGLHLALHPSQPLLYVSVPYVDRVMEVNTTTMDTVRSFGPGSTIQAIAVAPNGAELYVANESSGLDVYDLSTGRKTQSVQVGGAFGLVASSSFIYLTQALPGKVTILDRVARVVLKRITVNGVPRRPALNAAGTMLVVPNESGWVDFIQ
jgi:Big-like domain-containing protein